MVRPSALFRINRSGTAGVRLRHHTDKFIPLRFCGSAFREAEAVQMLASLNCQENAALLQKNG